MHPRYLPATASDDSPAGSRPSWPSWPRRSAARAPAGRSRATPGCSGRSSVASVASAVTPAHVLAWAHGIGLSGREPSSATVGARIACLSSYYRFLIRMQVASSNPCDALERPKGVQSVARGLGADEVRRLLAVVPDTVAGRRDRALLLTFVLTGRRRAEVIGLTAGDISVEGETAFYRYRGKGGKGGRRELPRPAYEALCATLADAGLSLAEMEPSASLWQAGAGPRGSPARRSTAGSGGTCGRLGWRRPGSTSSATPRPSSAAMPGRRSRRSRASSTTRAWRSPSVYLRRLEGETDRTWPDVAVAIGVLLPRAW